MQVGARKGRLIGESIIICKPWPEPAAQASEYLKLGLGPHKALRKAQLGLA